MIVAAQMFGTLEPATGVMLSRVGDSGVCSTKFPGCQATASTVSDVTEMVLPRVHAGNFVGEMVRVSV